MHVCVAHTSTAARAPMWGCLFQAGIHSPRLIRILFSNRRQLIGTTARYFTLIDVCMELNVRLADNTGRIKIP